MNNRHLFTLFILLFLFALCATISSALESPLQLTHAEKNWIKDHSEVLFTGDPNWLPYEAFLEDGTYIGLVADHLQTIEKLTGLRFKSVPVNNWSESLQNATDGKVDVISGDAADVILNKRFHPVDAYSQNPIVIIMNYQENYIEHLEEIKDKKIAIIKDYGYTADILKYYPDFLFVEVENIQEVGTLKVSLAEIEATSSGTITDCPQISNGTYLDLEISDTGCGIKSSILSKIFDPFFTTKEIGKGTGLGLAVVHGIVKQHKGEITITSEPNQGTTFHVYLPVIEAEVQDKNVVSEAPPQGNGERVLFVDDEIILTRLMQRTLENQGYTVTIFSSSVEALNAYQKNPSEFDLVITDMTMPEMTGVDLAKKLLELQPNLPIVLCTGFSETIDKAKAKALGICGYVKKPVDTFTLAQAIKSALKC